MTDRGLIERKLSEVENLVQELKTFGRPPAIHEDVVQQRFIERTLQVAIQAVIDVASHIISDQRLGEPRTLRAMASLLSRHGWVSSDLAVSLDRMVGFRNVLVLDYDTVDLDVVETIANEHLADFELFVRAIRSRLAAL